MQYNYIITPYYILLWSCRPDDCRHDGIDPIVSHLSPTEFPTEYSYSRDITDLLSGL